MYLRTHLYDQHLAVQQRRDLLAEVFNNGIRTTLDLQTGRNGMQLDVRDDRPGNLVDLLGLLLGPHRGTELCGVLVGDLAEGGVLETRRHRVRGGRWLGYSE